MTVVITAQNTIKQILHEWQIRDVDDYARRLAHEINHAISGGLDLKLALEQVRSVPTASLSRDARSRLLVELDRRLERRGAVPELQVADLLIGFAEHAESQLARALKADRSEELVRTALQSRLSAYGVTRREAHEGAGATDLWFRRSGAADEALIEVKVPNSTREYEDGLIEVGQYARSSGLRSVFYVVVDHCPDLATPRFGSDRLEILRVDGINVTCIFIRVSAAPPSKVGRTRRAGR